MWDTLEALEEDSVGKMESYGNGSLIIRSPSLLSSQVFEVCNA